MNVGPVPEDDGSSPDGEGVREIERERNILGLGKADRRAMNKLFPSKAIPEIGKTPSSLSGSCLLMRAPQSCAFLFFSVVFVCFFFFVRRLFLVLRALRSGVLTLSFSLSI